MGNAFTVSIDIDAPPEAVWAVLGAPDHVSRWYPQYTSCVTDGDIRTLTRADGSVVTERLLERDDARRFYRYGVIDGVPLRSHRASFEVLANGTGSRVLWSTEGEPLEEGADLEARLADRQRAALEGLRALFA
ncbi:MAG: SRPBCC family protein [Thermoleophilia bacterium]|nr:SRPBCC family protein [Thermoleophilia bacterium]